MNAKVTITSGGMSCAACAARVERAIILTSGSIGSSSPVFLPSDSASEP